MFCACKYWNREIVTTNIAISFLTGNGTEDLKLLYGTYNSKMFTIKIATNTNVIYDTKVQFSITLKRWCYEKFSLTTQFLDCSPTVCIPPGIFPVILVFPHFSRIPGLLEKLVILAVWTLRSCKDVHRCESACDDLS